MIFLLKLRLLLTLYFVHLSKDSGMLWWKWERSLTCQTIYLTIFLVAIIILTIFIVVVTILEAIPILLIYLGEQKRAIKAAYEDFKKK
jgi:cytochrome c biogenesis protein ResB